MAKKSNGKLKITSSDMSSQDSTNYWITLSIVTLVSLWTRIYKIAEPSHVCWDETHFGKMGSWYINRTFFFDVHPPLGKMMIGAAGLMTGYNGSFAFTKPGDKYLDYPYVGMRVFCAILGSLVVPIMFVAVFDLSKSFKSAVTASCLLIFDVGFITLSQYILLDPLLIFFISGSFMAYVKVLTRKESSSWTFLIFWSAMTGLFLSAAVSVKFVGLFVVTVVGLMTIVDLWTLLGLEEDINQVVKHFFLRVVTLIVFPILLYMLFFSIHLTVLSKSGSGDGFFSSQFQASLEGNSLFNASMPRQVAYGAQVSLKNIGNNGYLHSHWHLFPEGVGSRQQQITGYSHKDENNKWIIKKFDEEYKEDEAVQVVRDGDLIRLTHVMTGRNLHSHKIAAPITKKDLQVTGYGENGTGDANDVWRVQIKEGDVLETLTSKFKLVHYMANCLLSVNSKQLPKWGFEQMEVSCSPNVLQDGKAVSWIIEDNFFPRLANVSFDHFKLSFLDKFLESHAVMFQGNSGLKPKEGEVTSRPWQWPINLRGQFFSGNEYKVYLLGNPVIWWSNVVLLMVYSLVQVVICVRNQRGLEIHDPKVKEYCSRLSFAGSWLLISWAMHYLPFYSMGRVLYYHHYFPAAIFSSCLSAVLLEFVVENVLRIFKFSSNVGHLVYGSLLAMLVYSFILFSPLAYGIVSQEVSNSNTTAVNSVQNIKWLDSWEF